MFRFYMIPILLIAVGRPVISGARPSGNPPARPSMDPGPGSTLPDHTDTSISHVRQLPGRYLSKAGSKADRLNSRMTRRTAKALRRLKKQEEKINKRLASIDSVAAHNLFSTSIDSLSRLQGLVKSKISGITGKIPGGQYIPYLDTLGSSLKFLANYSDKLNHVKGLRQKLQGSLQSVQQLEGRMDQLQDIQQYIQQRQQLLKETLGNYGGSFSKYLGRYGKEAYYYQAQVKNYKEIWQHPDRVEAKAMEMLNKVPAFNSFMKEHSMLAGLFRLPDNYGSAAPASLDGLQTRAMVEREIEQRLQAAGPGGRQQIRQGMAQARQQLQQLKDKLPASAEASAGMPGFKPKDLKSKPFLRRLEFGSNIQFGKAALRQAQDDDGGYLPTTSDIAAQVAYKFSDKGSAGIGAAFKLGWGSNIRKIHFTVQGLGLRSFLDYRLHGSIYINGGFEFNHQRTIPNMPALKDLNGWTKSALLGIERKYKISDKLGGNMMLLFDFLYKQHVPARPVVFRVGYNF